MRILDQSFTESSLRDIDQLVHWIMDYCIKKDFDENLAVVPEQQPDPSRCVQRKIKEEVIWHLHVRVHEPGAYVYDALYGVKDLMVLWDRVRAMPMRRQY